MSGIFCEYQRFKKTKVGGQIATLFVLFIVIVFLLMNITLNIGILAQKRTNLTMAADSGALGLASNLSSRGRYLSHNFLNDGIYVMRKSLAGWIAALVFLFTLLGKGSIQEALINAIIAGLGTVLREWYEIYLMFQNVAKEVKKMGQKQQMAEGGIFPALIKAADDKEKVQDIHDFDEDGDTTDKINRFMFYYRTRTRQLAIQTEDEGRERLALIDNLKGPEGFGASTSIYPPLYDGQVTLLRFWVNLLDNNLIPLLRDLEADPYNLDPDETKLHFSFFEDGENWPVLDTNGDGIIDDAEKEQAESILRSSPNDSVDVMRWNLWYAGIERIGDQLSNSPTSDIYEGVTQAGDYSIVYWIEKTILGLDSETLARTVDTWINVLYSEDGEKGYYRVFKGWLDEVIGNAVERTGWENALWDAKTFLEEKRTEEGLSAEAINWIDNMIFKIYTHGYSAYKGLYRVFNIYLPSLCDKIEQFAKAFPYEEPRYTANYIWKDKGSWHIVSVAIATANVVDATAEGYPLFKIPQFASDMDFQPLDEGLYYELFLKNREGDACVWVWRYDDAHPSSPTSPPWLRNFRYTKAAQDIDWYDFRDFGVNNLKEFLEWLDDDKNGLVDEAELDYARQQHTSFSGISEIDIVLANVLYEYGSLARAAAHFSWQGTFKPVLMSFPEGVPIPGGEGGSWQED